MAGQDFAEASVAADPVPLLTKRVVHIPWWHYTRLLARFPLSADIVYSNSNLGEMNVLALKHVLETSREMLADSDVGLFMYMSTGMLAQNSAEGLATEFEQFGYRKAIEEPFVGYTVGTRDLSEIESAFKDGIPHHNPSGSQTRLSANQVMELSRAEAPLDAELSRWNHGWVPPYRD